MCLFFISTEEHRVRRSQKINKSLPEPKPSWSPNELTLTFVLSMKTSIYWSKATETEISQMMIWLEHSTGVGFVLKGKRIRFSLTSVFFIMQCSQFHTTRLTLWYTEPWVTQWVSVYGKFIKRSPCTAWNNYLVWEFLLWFSSWSLPQRTIWGLSRVR